jgi:hypothetical protein
MPRTITTTSRLRRPIVLVGVLLLLLSSREPIHGLSYQQQQPATQDRHPPPPSSSVRLQVYYDSSQGMHRDLYYHPEQPARITQCLAAIRGMALTEPTSSDGCGGAVKIQLIDCAPAVVQEETIQGSSSSSPLRRDDHGGYTTTTTTTTRRPEERRVPITADELAYAEQLLLRTHAPELVHNLKQKSRQAQAERLAKGKPALGHVSTTTTSTT